jgi:hypothetical protein
MGIEISGGLKVVPHIFVPDEFPGRRGHVALLLEIGGAGG